MKLQVAFDIADLDEALKLALQIEPFVNIVEIGSLLIYRYGVHAIAEFRIALPKVMLLADVKIADRPKEAVLLCTEAGADWVTVLAGANQKVIRAACAAAHAAGKKIMLDLIDANSLGQSAMEAQALGVDALLFHTPIDVKQSGGTLIESWDMVRGNTNLPIYFSGSINRETVYDIIALQPSALVVGKGITHAENPREEARFYYELVK